MGDLYIGLISGTSMDGIDAALVEFDDASLNILQTRAHDYPDALSERLSATIQEPETCTIDDVGSLDRAIGECFRDAANALLTDAGFDASAIAAIGSHGQTLRHQPQAAEPFSLQIGDPNVIATGTGITTVADFRRTDMALGGEGAPLVPAFHEWLFGAARPLRAVLNIGGIANITVMPGGSGATTGFDTGPGNTLLDAWTRKHRATSFDADGKWAASGTVNEKLLTRLLADPYFSATPPKSTGFEYFNLAWLGRACPDDLDPADVQATLCALTATSIADAIHAAAPTVGELLVCGGGVHNSELMRQLGSQLADVPVASTATAGLDPDWVEAAAFAWLAMRRLQGRTGNLPSVTGASRPAVLGAIYLAA